LPVGFGRSAGCQGRQADIAPLGISTFGLFGSKVRRNQSGFPMRTMKAFLLPFLATLSISSASRRKGGDLEISLTYLEYPSAWNDVSNIRWILGAPSHPYTELPFSGI